MRALATGNSIGPLPPPPGLPGAPTLTTATVGGTLVPGTYTYAVATATTGGTSAPGATATIVVPAGTNTNTVTVNYAAARVVGQGPIVGVYGRTAGNFGLLAADSAGSWVDTGANPVTTAPLPQYPGTDTQRQGPTSTAMPSTVRPPESAGLAAVGRGQVSVT